MKPIGTIINVELNQIACTAVTTTIGAITGKRVENAVIQIGSTYLYMQYNELLALHARLSELLDK